MRLALSAMLLQLPALLASVAMAQAPKNPMGGGKQMPGPAKMDAATVAAWHADMKKWRDEYRASVKYNGTAVYSDPQLTWTQTSYMQPQMHPCEYSIHRTSSDAPRHATRRCGTVSWHCTCMRLRRVVRVCGMRVCR